MAERYDLEAARAAYDATPAAATAIQFWHGVANRLARGVHGVEVRLAQGENWRAKVSKPRRCPACGERYTWHGFADGGRSQICHHCASQIAGATEGRR